MAMHSEAKLTLEPVVVDGWTLYAENRVQRGKTRGTYTWLKTRAPPVGLFPAALPPGWEVRQPRNKGAPYLQGMKRPASEDAQADRPVVAGDSYANDIAAIEGEAPEIVSVQERAQQVVLTDKSTRLSRANHAYRVATHALYEARSRHKAARKEVDDAVHAFGGMA